MLVYNNQDSTSPNMPMAIDTTQTDTMLGLLYVSHVAKEEEGEQD